MKKILGLDLGTTSIGWAFVHEAENEIESSKIIKMGVRISQLDNFDKVDKNGKVTESKNPLDDFASGKGLSPNAGRTQKRGARRNLQRFKLRRENLIEILKTNKLITDETILAERGNKSTFETLKLRSLAVEKEISKAEFARVLLSINKKRGYKSSRKAKNEEEGQIIDGMTIAKKLYEQKITPGQYCLQLMQNGKKVLPDFYRSDLQDEFEKIWAVQKQYYPEIFTEDFYKKLQGQGMQSTRKMFLAIYQVYTAENKGSREDKKLQAYKWRVKALSEKLELSEAAFVICEVNNNLNQSSGYLGKISDRSKELYFNNLTVGQYLYKQIKENPHTRLKGQVFYRQDYLDEFERIWTKQKTFHPELNNDLKDEIRDVVVFYQRKLRSQKQLVSFCEFENRVEDYIVDGKIKLITTGSRVAPKSSPLFQEFKIWQILSNIIIRRKSDKEEFILSLETKQQLFDELNIRGNLKKEDVLKLLGLKPTEWELNYTSIEGNRTNLALYEAFFKMFEFEGHELDFSKLSAKEIDKIIRQFFIAFGIKTSILEFDALLDGKDFELQDSYQLWHLLYSYEGDESHSGNETLYRLLEEKYGFKREHAQILANIALQDDYGSLSTKAIRKIMPFIKENKYSEACALAGYNHSASISKEENLSRILKGRLEILPKNSLRNPVVEKILNQLVNVVNAILADSQLGRPDEIRIELARELKKNAKERAEMTQNINKAKDDHEKFRKELQSEFGIKNPTRNDIIRYKLYLELEPNGFKTLYTNTYLSKEKLFSKEFDIEHIIPKARLFDDSFSNKTLEVRQANIDKSDDTAFDFVLSKYGESALKEYVTRIEHLYKNNSIGKAKCQKLLKKGVDIGDGFIERDLRESQYIARKAKDLLLEVSRMVVSTSGTITDKLREDWGLINTMQELNFEKYRTLGLTETITNKDGQTKERIIDWTKRNDHRHHAMDALTIAFTKHNIIQYLNYLNARKDVNHKLHKNIIAIEEKITTKDEKGKRIFKSPMNNFRGEAKKHLESILISFKAKNKVATRNKNKVKGSSKAQITLTPRGQLHKETVYGKHYKYVTKEIKIGTTCNETILQQVTKKAYREALLHRLKQHENNPTKAFGGKNTLSKNPLYYAPDKAVPEKVKIVTLDYRFSIRKDINPENFKDLKNIDKIIDKGIRNIILNRFKAFNNNPKEAFSNLEKNPIWLNKEKGISIKCATISGVANAEPLHHKKDHLGKFILDKVGYKIPVDYVSTGNNHHVAIYKDDDGNLQEEVVSFYEAVARINEGLPVIKTTHENGWQFMFTMKQNEMFVFPSEEFNPNEIDLLDPVNYHSVSPHLFRLQKATTRDYFFRHHLETNVDLNSSLKGLTWMRLGISGINGIVKVRINHLGQIISVGEY